MIKTQKEYETRLMLTEEQYFFIVTYYMNIQPNKHFLQNTNHYFDTDDLYLRDHHMTLRVRTINDVKSELTLKIKGRNGDDEITDGLSPKEQELLLEQNIDYNLEIESSVGIVHAKELLKEYASKFDLTLSKEKYIGKARRAITTALKKLNNN